jgi:nitroreductase
MGREKLTRRGLLKGGSGMMLFSALTFPLGLRLGSEQAGLGPGLGFADENPTLTEKEKKKSLRFATVVKQRAMIRAYTNDPVPEEKVQRLLTYAVRAPSAGNLQPWEFIVVRDPAVKKRLTAAAFGQTPVAEASVIIATCANVQRAGSRYGQRGMFFSLVDASFASLLILLGAVDEGLGACFVGAYHPEEVAKILALPDHVRPVGLITLGYPAEQPRKPSNPRLRLEDLVHFDKW